MSIGPLAERVSRLCSALEETLTAGDDDAREQVAITRDRLAGPLRVAVVGRVKAGKSTLVNALVGRRIAPTATTEMTRVVTWYRFGSPDRAEVVLHDGRRLTVSLDEVQAGSLPVPLEQIDRLEMHLQARSLRTTTLIDTPGLASLTSELGATTRRAIVGEDASRRAAGHADAVVFVFRDSEHVDELEFLRSFASATGELGATASNALGVLGFADVYGSGPAGGSDPVETARRRAAELTAVHREQLAEVVAVAGLLAETARTGEFTESDAAALSRLARVDATRLQLWEHLGVHDEVGLDEATLRGLFERLGPYGVQHGAVLALEGAAPVIRWLDERGGVAELEETIRQRFAVRADALKADHALAVLERVVSAPEVDPAARARCQNLLEQARLGPDLHPIREVRALDRLLANPDPHGRLVQRLEQLVAQAPLHRLLDVPPGDPDALHAAVLAEASWAQGIAATANHPDLAEAGRVVSRSFLLLAQGHERLTSG